jgi:hypothetical protein
MHRAARHLPDAALQPETCPLNGNITGLAVRRYDPIGAMAGLKHDYVRTQALEGH